MTWQPIETAPKDTVIILANHEQVEYECSWHYGGWTKWGMTMFENMGNVGLGFEPTHWMPQIEPPKEKTA
jgi:hypothetical protein